MNVRCTVCSFVGQWTTSIHSAFSQGHALKCEECKDRLNTRVNSGKRASIAIGNLRPDITLYGEQGREDFFISDVIDADVRSKPDCLIVMGTSLKVGNLITKKTSRIQILL